MARRRILHPGFFTDVDLLALSPLHRLLFQGLWCWADKAGRLDDKPTELKIKILPMDQCDVDAMLSDLASNGRLIRYVAGSRKYIEIVNFQKYQNPHPREPESEIPAANRMLQMAAELHGQPCNYTASNAVSGIRYPVSDPVRDLKPLAPSAKKPAADAGVDGSPKPELTPASAPEPLSEFARFVGDCWPDVKKPQEQEARWTAAYPGVDLLAEGRKALAWEQSDPRRRKVRHGPFLNSWFARAQQQASRDDIRRSGPGPPAYTEPTPPSHLPYRPEST